jgi:hypothetical protein
MSSSLSSLYSPFVMRKMAQTANTVAFGFVGPSYTNSSIYADGEELINLLIEPIESGKGLNTAYLKKCPGLSAPLVTLPNGPVRGLFEMNGRAFAAAGARWYEILPDGTYLDLLLGYPDLGAPTGPVMMASSGKQVLITGRNVTPALFDLDSNVLIPTACPALVFQCGFVDGYFIGLEYGTRKFWISNQYDGATWDGLDFGARAGTGDNSAGLLIDHEQLWLFGNKNTEIWYNSGNASFPFARIPQAILPMGLSAPDSAACVDNTVFWIGQNSLGAEVVYRAAGWTPQRISNHAMEAQIQKYPRRDDAIGWGYQQDGHTFYMLTFPSAFADQTYGPGGVAQVKYRGETWCYDVVTQMWHKRGWWDADAGSYQAHLGQCHAFAFGKHLVGDRVTGAIYALEPGTFTDNGHPIRWLRSAPHLSSEERWNFYHSLQVYMQAGTNENVVMQYSNDGGNRWGTELGRTVGASGEYATRVRWTRLGKARNRCFRLIGDGNCPTAIIDAYLNVTPAES